MYNMSYSTSKIPIGPLFWAENGENADKLHGLWGSLSLISLFIYLRP